jgi:hypothetical protein
VKWPPAWDPVSYVVSRQEFCMGGCDKRNRVQEAEESFSV